MWPATSHHHVSLSLERKKNLVKFGFSSALKQLALPPEQEVDGSRMSQRAIMHTTGAAAATTYAASDSTWLVVIGTMRLFDLVSLIHIRREGTKRKPHDGHHRPSM